MEWAKELTVRRWLVPVLAAGTVAAAGLLTCSIQPDRIRSITLYFFVLTGMPLFDLGFSLLGLEYDTCPEFAKVAVPLVGYYLVFAVLFLPFLGGTSRTRTVFISIAAAFALAAIAYILHFWGTFMENM